MSSDAGKQIYKHVASRVHQIENGNPAAAKAQLARLRRGIGKQLQDMPELWGVMLEEMPDDLVGKGDQPSPAEKAVYIAMTMFGLSMQGHTPSKDSTNEKEVSLGAAAGKYTQRTGEEESRILPRLQKVITANSVKEMEVPLRSMIQLLNQEEVRLDYAGLARDLFYYSGPKGREVVRLRWARDYYKNLRPPKEDSEKSQ